MLARRIILELVEAYNPDEHVPFKKRLGRCYELAGRFASGNQGCFLVHGTVQGFGKPPLEHAWVELEDSTVFEPSTNKIYPAEVFNAIFNPQPAARYSHQGVLKHSLKHEHWGPWR